MRCDFDVSGIARCKGGRADYPAGADHHVTLRFDGDRAGIACALGFSLRKYSSYTLRTRARAFDAQSPPRCNRHVSGFASILGLNC